MQYTIQAMLKASPFFLLLPTLRLSPRTYFAHDPCHGAAWDRGTCHVPSGINECKFPVYDVSPFNSLSVVYMQSLATSCLPRVIGSEPRSLDTTKACVVSESFC